MPLADANERAIADVVTVAPRLVAIKPAREVVPGMRPELILHAAPPTDWDSLAPSVHAALAGAAEFEGLSPSETELGAAQDHSAMAGGAGAITASTPVVVVEDQVSGERAYHFLMEGFGRALILGMTGEDVFGRLRWLRDDAAPALDAALQAWAGSTATRSCARRCGAATSCITATPPPTRCWPSASLPAWPVPGRAPSFRSVCSSSCAATPSSSSPCRWRRRG